VPYFATDLRHDADYVTTSSIIHIKMQLWRII